MCYRLLLAILLMGCCCKLHAQTISLPANGWVRWEFAAVSPATQWCCARWQRGVVEHTACSLDQPSNGITRMKDTIRPEQTRSQLLLKMVDGKARELRVYGFACEVSSQTAIKDLGLQSSTVSLNVLQQRAAEFSDLDLWLAAVGAHDSPLATTQMAETARHRNAETRRKALFWLTQLRGAAGRDAVLEAMKHEQQASVRKHAVFALSQLPEPLASESLITMLKQAQTDRMLRKEALFWLAQMESPAALAYLTDVLN
jgi:hypothetical protein